MTFIVFFPYVTYFYFFKSFFLHPEPNSRLYSIKEHFEKGTLLSVFFVTSGAATARVAASSTCIFKNAVMVGQNVLTFECAIIDQLNARLLGPLSPCLLR